MNIIYIHGASATSDSFNYLRQQLNFPNETLVEYHSEQGFERNLEDMTKQLEGIDRMLFICHSLGGIYALRLSEIYPQQTLGAVTLATPYNGAESADYAKYFLPFSRLLRDIGPNSAPIKRANSIKIQHPWLNIVPTRGGAPWIVQPNDGVVTIGSMRHRTDMRFEDVYTNHYEVVQSPKTVEIIRHFIDSLV